MTYRRRRPRLSAAQRTVLWARWKRGARLSDIAAGLGRAPATAYARIRKAGGIPERPRQRAARALSAAEREQISRGLAEGLGGAGDRPGAGARAVDGEPGDCAQWRDSAVSGGPGRAGRVAPGGVPQALKLKQQPRLCRLVAEKLEARRSPQQIAGWLQRTFPAEPAL
jgi:IS30 family transposase